MAAMRCGRLAAAALAALALVCSACSSGDAIAAGDVAAARALAGTAAATEGAGGSRPVGVRVSIVVAVSDHPNAKVLCRFEAEGPSGAALVLTASGPGPAGPYPQCAVDPVTQASAAGLAAPAMVALLGQLGHDRLIGRATVDGVGTTEYEGVVPAGTRSALAPLGPPAAADVVDAWLDGSGRLVRYEAQVDPAASASGTPTDAVTVEADLRPG